MIRELRERARQEVEIIFGVYVNGKLFKSGEKCSSSSVYFLRLSLVVRVKAIMEMPIVKIYNKMEE
jgi:hypothetical protein